MYLCSVIRFANYGCWSHFNPLTYLLTHVMLALLRWYMRLATSAHEHVPRSARPAGPSTLEIFKIVNVLKLNNIRIIIIKLEFG